MARRGAASGRRQARERALALLYEADLKGSDPAEVVAGLPVPADPYTVTLVEGVAAHGRDLDAHVARVAHGWAPERMPVVDRAVLRMAAYELCHRPEVPTAVVISEAVELAKLFSTEDSGRFVNGVLARVAAEVRPS